MTDRKPPSLTEVEWSVRTERLLLRPAPVTDMGQVWTSWRRRDDAAQWMTNPSPDLDAYPERLASPEQLATLLVVELWDDTEHEGQIVLDLHVCVQDSCAQADVADHARASKANLGWSMDPTVQGRGLATEALRALLGICFDGMLASDWAAMRHA